MTARKTPPSPPAKPKRAPRARKPVAAATIPPPAEHAKPPAAKKRAPAKTAKPAAAKRKPPATRKGPVVTGIERELKRLGPEARASALAALALSLGREMDSAQTRASAKSMCARVLLDTLNKLREIAPPQAKKDRVDELRKQRERRLART